MTPDPGTGADGITRHLGVPVRGRRDRRELALVFTGGDYGEACEGILDTLKRYALPASFFLTGDFLRNPGHGAAVRRMAAAPHYAGPHSDRHLLYCPWEDRGRMLVDRKTFLDDLDANLAELERFGVDRRAVHRWIPPYEWYNECVARWAEEAGYPLFNFTPGTLSHADYTEEGAPNYRSSEEILGSIVRVAAEAPEGLNGFFLLLHLGAGEGRRDKFWKHLPALLDFLQGEGYGFRTVPQLLAPDGAAPWLRVTP